MRNSKSLRPRTNVRSLQIKITGEAVRDLSRRFKIADAVKRAGRLVGLDLKNEDRDAFNKRGTVVEFKGDKRVVLKAWVANDNLMVVHARDEAIAAKVFKELVKSLHDDISEGRISMTAEADVEYCGAKREIDKIAKLPWWALGFKVEHSRVRKGRNEHPIIMIKDGSGRTLLKIYVRAPSSRRPSRVGGNDGAWGAESTVKVKLTGETSHTFTGHAATPKSIAIRRRGETIAKRLLINPKRAAKFVASWLEAHDPIDVLHEFKIIKFPELVKYKFMWILACDYAVRILLDDRKVSRELRKLSSKKSKYYKTKKLDNYQRKDNGGGGPP